MAERARPLGCSALLRVAGCPIRFWLVAGNADLFSMLRRLNQAEDDYRALGARLADRFGDELVPHPSLTRQDRALALRLRRTLHKGAPMTADADRQLIARVRDTFPATASLRAELDQAVGLSGVIATLEADVMDALARESGRLACTAWAIIHASSVAGFLVGGRQNPLYQEIERRLDRGDAWGSKALRQPAAVLWQMIERAATKSTPRGWHSHTALLPIRPGASGADEIAVTADFATDWMENVHASRRSTQERLLDRPAPDAEITIAPLHWQDGGRLVCWVVDLDNPSRMTELSLRLTDLLDDIATAVKSGPATIEAIETAVLPEPDARQRDLLRRFVGHLAGLGVIQISAPPRHCIDLWRPASTLRVDERREHSSTARSGNPEGDGADPLRPRDVMADGFRDVYRRTTSGFGEADARRIQRSVEQALRILTIMTPGRISSGGLPAALDEQPQSVIELLRAYIEADGSAPAPKRHLPGWPPAATDDSPCARLLSWLAERASDGTELDIDAALLDQIEAPAGVIDWPIDCLLRQPRPGAGCQTVLDQIFLAGAMDARFIAALSNLHGAVPHAEAYRQFLEQLERDSGVTFVELLIPPLSEGAANAVRRPLYTRAWTGDADLRTYCAEERTALQYIPLERITIRRMCDRLVIEADGRPIVPVYHATRSPLPPWNLLIDILMSAAPRLTQWTSRRLSHSLDALPQRDFMPRVTVGADLTLSGAQWRIGPAQLWDTSSSTLSKARALERVRRCLRLPRWVFVSRDSQHKPAACDLESLRAIRTIERAGLAAGAALVFVEMLPAPDELLVADNAHHHGDRLVSEILLRLPCDESPQAMAARLAPGLAQKFGL